MGGSSGQFQGAEEAEDREGEGRRGSFSQEGGAHSKQLMHWRVKAPQLVLMMQSGREKEGPEVSAGVSTYLHKWYTLPFLGHSGLLQTH